MNYAWFAITFTRPMPITRSEELASAKTVYIRASNREAAHALGYSVAFEGIHPQAPVRLGKLSSYLEPVFAVPKGELYLASLLNPTIKVME